MLIRVGQLFRALSENFQQCRTWVNILLGKNFDTFYVVVLNILDDRKTVMVKKIVIKQ